MFDNLDTFPDLQEVSRRLSKTSLIFSSLLSAHLVSQNSTIAFITNINNWIKNRPQYSLFSNILRLKKYLLCCEVVIFAVSSINGMGMISLES